MYFAILFKILSLYCEGAITETRRSVHRELEYPSLTICPNPPFKPSVSRHYKFTFPIRDLFTKNTDTTTKIYKDLFHNFTIPELYENFTYHNDLTFIYDNVELMTGTNRNEKWRDQEIELKKVPASYLGTCHLLQFKNKSSQVEWNETSGLLYIGHKDGLEPQDVPRSFKIYFNERHKTCSINILICNIETDAKRIRLAQKFAFAKKSTIPRKSF